MNKKINLEFLVGLFILILASFLLFYISINFNIVKPTKNFELKSSFFDIGSLELGSDVKINGVKVGEVDDISLNLDTYMAIVGTSYYKKINIPSDSFFKISNNGFVGSSFVEISLGNSNLFLKDLEETYNNIDAISLEEIINTFIFK